MLCKHAMSVLSKLAGISSVSVFGVEQLHPTVYLDAPGAGQGGLRSGTGLERHGRGRYAGKYLGRKALKQSRREWDFHAMANCDMSHQ